MTNGWAAWLDERMAALGLSGAALSTAASVPESMISRWRRLGVRPAVAQLRRLAAPLQIEVLDLLVVSGHLSEDDVLRPAPPAHPGWDDARKALAADPDIDADLRQLLLVQYDAVRALTASRRTTSRSTKLLRASERTLEGRRRIGEDASAGRPTAPRGGG